jgi:N-acetylglucosamine-6-phosphate deacetylase
VNALTLRGGRVVTPAGVVEGDVVVRDGRIAAVGPAAAATGEVVELDGRWVLPGFIDVHVHGGGGAQCNTGDPDEVRRVAAFHARSGTTALLATTVAAPVDDLLDAVRAIEAARRAPAAGAAEILGAHLEGPFLNPSGPGAMEGEAFLAPDVDVLTRLLAGGRVLAMSLAPELPGAMAVIERASARGVRVSLGHTDATYAQARAAVEAGARSVTHAFNAMRPLHHREPGMVGAALDLDALACEVICDGVHVDPVAVRLLAARKGPERTLLVTDAIEATGLRDGEYRLGDRRVTVRDGRATLPGHDTIAGSTLTMDRALRNTIAFTGASVPEAAQMAATTPARLLGIADRKGTIAVGLDADLVLLAPEDLALAGVLVRGEWVSPPALAAPAGRSSA